MATMLTSVPPTQGGVPSRAVVSGGKLFFTELNSANGVELYCSDGTAGGTYCVRDIAPGTASSSPSLLTPFNNQVLFTADDGVHGRELWISDGTAAGTHLVKDIYANQQVSSQIFSITVFNGAAYFTADDGNSGSELWTSDGTAAGTKLVKDTYPGLAGGALEYYAVANGVLFFVAGDSNTGWELWKSDGTTNGTALLKDITVGPNSSFIRNFTVVGNILYFTNNKVNVQELWKSDGTSSGTVLVTQINASNSYLGSLTAFNGKLFFVADDGTSGRELWCSGGTAATTAMIMDICPGAGSSVEQSTPMAGIGTQLLFPATDGVNGVELWSTDGTAAGTAMVADLASGIGSSSPRELFSLGGVVYFAADDGVNGTELWKSDGTAVGTVLVKDIPLSASNPSNFSSLGGIIYYTASGGLWRSDGTDSGTYIAAHNNNSGGASPGGMTEAGGVVLFSATDPTNGSEIWQSDGTPGGTLLLKDIFVGNLSSSPRNFTPYNGYLLFSATESGVGEELWKSDGTPSGTLRIADVNAGSSSSQPSQFTPLPGGIAVFSAFKSGQGFNLWQTDGQTASLVKNISPYTSIPFVNLNGIAVFTASDGVSGNELWRSDGTPSGTYMIKDIAPGSGNSTPSKLTVAGNQVFFVVGSELWKSDGTSSGTSAVLGAPSNYSPFELTAAGNYLFFSADNFTNGRELWRSDGTPSGTAMVKDLIPGSTGSNPQNMAYVNGLLFFSAFDSTNGRELWISDGTSAGTALLKDILGGLLSSDPQNMTPVAQKGVMVFTAADESGGVEPWISDGTVAGTHQLVDIAPGGASSYPVGLKLTSTGIYLNADDNINGRQLWRIPLSDLGADLPTLSISNTSLAEGNAGTSSMTFGVSLSASSSKIITVQYATEDGDAFAGKDYVATSGQLTFNPGQTSQNIVVQINGNVLNEFDRVLHMNLFNAHNTFITTAKANGAILDDDPVPTLSIANASVTEGNSGTIPISFTLTLSAASGKTVTVQAATQAVSATAGQDFVSNSGSTITLLPGETSATFTCQVLGDQVDEPDENFHVNLSGAVNATIAQSQATGVIVDDDDAGITISPVVLNTVEGLKNASFTIRLNSIPTDTVTITLNNGNPAEGSLSQSVLTFAPDASALLEQSVTVTGIDDQVVDGDITYQIVPNVSSNDAAYASLSLTSITVTNSANKPPSLQSSFAASPSPVTVGRPVTFSFVASDPEGSAVTYTLDYGDGTSGTELQHIFTSAQTYNVVLTLSDGKNAVSATTQVTVFAIDDPSADPDGDGISNKMDSDDDGDGFSDSLESELGSSSLNASDTPLNAQANGSIQPFSISQLRIKLNFSKPQHDSIQLQGALPIPDNFVINGQRIAFAIGHVARVFTLDKSGKAKSNDGSVRVSFKSSRGAILSQTAKLKCNLGPAGFAASLSADGLTNDDTSAATVNAVVTAIFNGTQFQSTQALFYKAKRDHYGNSQLAK